MGTGCAAAYDEHIGGYDCGVATVAQASEDGPRMEVASVGRSHVQGTSWKMAEL